MRVPFVVVGAAVVIAAGAVATASLSADTSDTTNELDIEVVDEVVESLSESDEQAAPASNEVAQWLAMLLDESNEPQMDDSPTQERIELLTQRADNLERLAELWLPVDGAYRSASLESRPAIVELFIDTHLDELTEIMLVDTAVAAKLEGS